MLPRLYLTNYKGAEDVAGLKQLGVTHIAAVGEEFMNDPPSSGIKYWRSEVSDDDHNGDLMASLLREVAAFIHKALKRKKGVVLVHCAAGVSRSATVVLGYMVLHCDMSLYDAFELMRKQRPCIWPNDSFMKALIELEHTVRRQKTINLEEYVHWGDYDGPTLSAPGAAPLSRLKRADTCKDLEMRELAVLEALASGEARAAMQLQRMVRQWLYCKHLNEAYVEASLRRPVVSFGSSTQLHEVSSMSSVASSVGLNREQRASAAAAATADARESRRSIQVSKLRRRPSARLVVVVTSVLAVLRLRRLVKMPLRTLSLLRKPSSGPNPHWHQRRRGRGRYRHR